MVQKEVGERILAAPGTSAFGALTVGVQSVASVERVLKVPCIGLSARPGRGVRGHPGTSPSGPNP